MIHKRTVLMWGALMWGLLTVIVILINYRAASETVKISEVCGHNRTVIYDDFGGYNDYVELYNPAKTAIDLTGYSLSDDGRQLDKYVFGEVSIQPGEYLLLWACNPVDAEYLENTSAYLGFSLRDEEVLYLANPAGRVIDKVILPKAESDVSYARNHAGKGWGIQQPTPGRENVAVSDEKPETQYVASPVFSHQAGFYEEKFSLEMTCEDGCSIYYTLDGTEPSLASLRYDGPVSIRDASENDNVYAAITDISGVSDYRPAHKVDKANIVRAVAVDEEGNQSEEAAATYFVNFGEKYGYDDIAVVSIITDPDNLFDYERGIYVKGKVYDSLLQIKDDYIQPANYNCEGKGWERAAHMEMFDETGELRHNQAVAIRIHGGLSTAFSQKSFNLYAQPEVDGQTTVFDGLFNRHESAMMLRTGGFRDWNMTKFRDALNQFLVEDRDILIQSAIPCQLFLDGEYWGLYNIQEKVDASFISSHYGVDEENVVALKNENIVSGEDEDYRLWQSVVEFAVYNDLSSAEAYAAISEMIDIQSYIDYNCFQIYVANCDSVVNNHARWRAREVSDDKYCDGKWRWILYDTDDSAGMPIDRVNYAQYDVDTFTGGHWSTTPMEDVLFSSLIQNEEFKERFVVSFMDMANANFDYQDNVKAVIENFCEQYAAGTVASHRRFRDRDYSEEDYLQEVALVEEFYEKRYRYITSYMKKDLGLEGELNSVTLKQDEPGGKIYINTLELEESKSFEGDYYSDYPIDLRAVPAQGYEIVGWDVDGTVVSDGEELELDMGTDHIVCPIWKQENN